MKKTTIFISTILLIFLFSCYNDSVETISPNPTDESKYYDQDPDCKEIKSGTCCDVDGRIFVETGTSYKYTYDYKAFNAPTVDNEIEWTVLSGSIILLEGQGTKEATFYFNKNFTKGEISGYNKKSLQCQSTILISKL
ncbi:hypothetical protein [Flavobacterium gelatinilyticum]|uniref:hypothetical protein n=1 Tax=Flavobacterium gelatinilyticum TaxID=3003260 RepID=UPI002480BF3A|nr:hypothetical protein [Flavobacterium gelatinilyticum]